MTGTSSPPTSRMFNITTTHDNKKMDFSNNNNDNDNKFSASYHGKPSSGDDATDNDSSDSSVATESFSSYAYSWPILFAIIPPLGALIFGKPDLWSDLLLLLLISFYLYYIIKVPWEWYFAARTRRMMDENVIQKQNSNIVKEAARNRYARELRHQELCALTFVLLSPAIGGYMLHLAKVYLTSYDRYVSHVNIVLFMSAAGIRPLMHIGILAKNRTLQLQRLIHYPSGEVELLKRRVQHLEHELSQTLQKLATKRDVMNIRDTLEPEISRLSKAVKLHEKKEQLLSTYSEEKFAHLESKFSGYGTFIFHQPRRGDRSIMTLLYYIMYLIFLPLNIALAVFGYAKYLLPRSLRVSRQKPMLQPPATSSVNDSCNENNQYCNLD